MITWNRDWFHPGESFWSISNKIAFANATNVLSVVMYLANVHIQCRDQLLFPCTQTALDICRVLGLDSAKDSQCLFATISETPNLLFRENWQIGVRFCQKCMESFIHKVHFQDRRNIFCDIHYEQIIDVCPRCARSFDPLCTVPWRCNCCGYQTVSPGKNWLQSFSQVIETTGKFHKTLHKDGDIDNDGYSLRNPGKNWELLARVFEEHSAVCHALFAAHRYCAIDEPYVAPSIGVLINPKCPAGAALVQSAYRFGVPAQARKGDWPVQAATYRGAEALAILDNLLFSQPADQHVRLIRAAVRYWVADALEAFIKPFEHISKTAVDWHVNAATMPSIVNIARNPVLMAQLVDKIETLVKKADGHCPAMLAVN